MSSVDRTFTLLGYKLDRKLGDLKARLREERQSTNTGANPWSPTTSFLDSLRRHKCGFGKLTGGKTSSASSAARPPSC